MKELSEDHEARMVCYSLVNLIVSRHFDHLGLHGPRIFRILGHEMGLLVRFSTEVKFLSLSISSA